MFATPDLPASAALGNSPRFERIQAPYPPGKCLANASLTLERQNPVLSRHFSSGVTPNNPELRNCCVIIKTLGRFLDRC